MLTAATFADALRTADRAFFLPHFVSAMDLRANWTITLARSTVGAMFEAEIFWIAFTTRVPLFVVRRAYPLHRLILCSFGLYLDLLLRSHRRFNLDTFFLRAGKGTTRRR